MFIECIKCDQLWKTCDGPDLLLLPAPELFDWFKSYIAHHGITHQMISDMSGVPLSTVHRLLAKDKDEISDFKYDTIHKMISGCRGKHDTFRPCPDPHAGEHLERMRELEHECDILKSHIEHHQKQETKYEADKVEYKNEAAAKVAHLKDQCNRLRKTAAIMTALLLAVLFAIIAFLIYDVTHSDIGWLR